jgi:protein phosphatase
MTSVLATKSFVITSFGSTDCGLVRENNEDNFLIDDARGVYAVADGCGGIPHGDQASLLTIQMIQNFYDEAVFRGDLFIKEMFGEINRAVFQEGHRLNADLGMATTLTMAQIVDNMLVIGHVGDSVVYLYRAGTLRQLTAEHTLKAAVCATLSPEECENVPEALGHTLTRCIGHKPTVDVDVLEMPLQPGDRVLLCTDGVTKYLDSEFVEKAFAVATSPEALVRSLLDEAGERGGMDNATGVSFFVKGNTPKIFGLSAAVKAK